MEKVGKIITFIKDGYIWAVDFVEAHPHAATWTIGVLLVAELVDFAHHLHALTLRQTKVERDEVDSLVGAADQTQELGAGADGEGLMAGLREGRPKAVAHEGGVVGDDNGLHSLHGCRACHTSSIGVGRPAR